MVVLAVRASKNRIATTRSHYLALHRVEEDEGEEREEEEEGVEEEHVEK